MNPLGQFNWRSIAIWVSPFIIITVKVFMSLVIGALNSMTQQLTAMQVKWFTPKCFFFLLFILITDDIKCHPIKYQIKSYYLKSILLIAYIICFRETQSAAQQGFCCSCYLGPSLQDKKHSARVILLAVSGVYRSFSPTSLQQKGVI